MHCAHLSQFVNMAAWRVDLRAFLGQNNVNSYLSITSLALSIRCDNTHRTTQGNGETGPSTLSRVMGSFPCMPPAFTQLLLFLECWGPGSPDFAVSLLTRVSGCLAALSVLPMDTILKN